MNEQLERDINWGNISSFSPDIQNKIIDSITSSNKKKIELGTFGRFFGKDIKIEEQKDGRFLCTFEC